MNSSQNIKTPQRIRTRFIAYTALILSSITFTSGVLVFLYMKSPAFENQLTGQVIKLKPRPMANIKDPNKWFKDYIEQRNKEYIEWETKGKWQ